VKAALPGTRIVVQSPDWLQGELGHVIAMPKVLLNGHDCAVAFPDREDVMCFYWHELAVES